MVRKVVDLLAVRDAGDRAADLSFLDRGADETGGERWDARRGDETREKEAALHDTAHGFSFFDSVECGASLRPFAGCVKRLPLDGPRRSRLRGVKDARSFEHPLLSGQLGGVAAHQVHLAAGDAEEFLAQLGDDREVQVCPGLELHEELDVLLRTGREAAGWKG